MNTFGPGLLGDLARASSGEWMVTDGLGGYAIGTIGGLRTRRYHGLLIAPVDGPSNRRMTLVALDAVLLDGDRRTRLATDEWSSGAVDPAGHVHLVSFDLDDGVPRWRWQIGDIMIEREIAMAHGSSTTAIVHRVVSSSRPISIELTALCTWRDAHGERFADSDPEVTDDPDGFGFGFEGRYRVTGPEWSRTGEWFRGVHTREEAARGLDADEDLWAAGTFTTHFDPLLSHGTNELAVVVTTEIGHAPAAATAIIGDARARAASLLSIAGIEAGDASTSTSTTGRLVLAADRFIISTPNGPTVDAGYPWFGEWSRDAMTSYEGLFLSTGRTAEGAALLRRAASSISNGMLRNTTDTGDGDGDGDGAYNTIDAGLWFIHAVGRHVEMTGDDAFGADLLPAVSSILDGYIAGTRFGIGVDDDGLVHGGVDGIALTWMDARVGRRAVTPRVGKPVEIQALWIAALRTAMLLAERARVAAPGAASVLPTALESFHTRFTRLDGLGLLDVVDGPDGDDASIRPNQLLAVSLPRGPFDPPDERTIIVARAVVAVCGRRLLTPLGLRTLDPTDPAYLGRHRGTPAQRDAAYHQGTVWPWLLGAWVDAARRVGRDSSHDLEALTAHLDEFGIGSVSETADGDAPHDCTGAPFQAWSVAETLRALRPATVTSRSAASRSWRRGRHPQERH